MIRRANTLALLVAGLGIVATATTQGPGEPPRALAEVWLDSRVPAIDDPDQICTRLLAAAATHSDSPIAELLIDEAADRLARLAAPEAQIGALRSLLGDGAHGLVDRRARVALAALYDRLTRDADWIGLDAYRDQATHFVVVGPFGDSGDFYGGVPFTPELRFPAPEERLQGRFGPVQLRKVDRDSWRAFVELGGGPHKKGCYYALHQVRTEAAQACWIEISTRSSFELFVNGERVEWLDRVVDRVPTRRFVPVRLAPGVNHVLFKATLEDYDDLALRYVDAVGRAISGLEELDADRAVARSPVNESDLPPAPPAFVDGLDALFRAARRRDDTVADELIEVASALADLTNGQRARGLESLWSLRESNPEDPRVALALAECFRRADDLPREISAAASRRLVEGAGEALPADHAEASMQKVALLRADDRLEDAVRMLEARLESDVAGPETFAALDSLLGELKFDSRQEQVRDLWLTRQPLDGRALSHALSDLVEAGRAPAALARLEEALAAAPGDRSLLDIGIELATNLGERERAEAMLAQRDRREPDSLRALRSRAKTAATLGDRDTAHQLWMQALAHEDADAGDLFDIGWELWTAEYSADAVAAFRRCLDIDPSRHAVRQLLNRLAGGPDFPHLDRFRVPEAEVDRMVSDFEPIERERGAPSSLLLDRMTVVFYPDGSRVDEIHQLRRLNDLAGVEAHEQADAAARADELLRLRTIGTDGLSYVPQRVRGTFAMPRLEAGAYIEELYREYHPAAEAEPWRSPDFWFQGQDEPFLRSDFVLVLPPNAPGDIRSRNFPSEPEVVELDDGWRALVFSRRDTPRLPREPGMPARENIVPIVTYGEDRSFDEAARNTAVAARFRARPTAPVIEATDQLLAAVEPGDRARLAAIHRFVHDQIAEGRGSPDPTAILLTRRGPRFFLMVAMLSAAKVPFRHASTMDAKEALRDTPPALFLGEDDYEMPAILVEPSDGQPVWLFADEPRHAPIGFVPSARLGAAALVLDDIGYEVMRIHAANPSSPGWRIRGDAAVSGGGDVRLSASLLLSDSEGLDIAERIREFDANRRTMVGRNLATQLFPGWTIADAKLPVLEPGSLFRAEVDAARRGAAQRVGDRLAMTLPLPESQMFRRYGAPSPRTLPFDVRGETTEEWDLLVRFEDGLSLLSIPRDVRVEHPLCDYLLTFRQEAEGLRIRRTVRMRPGRVEAGEFADWTRRLQTIDRGEAARIELAPAPE